MNSRWLLPEVNFPDCVRAGGDVCGGDVEHIWGELCDASDADGRVEGVDKGWGTRGRFRWVN